MWLPSPANRVTSHSDPDELQQWAFGRWPNVELYGNTSAALAIVAERSKGGLLFAVGGYGTASMTASRCISFTTATLNKPKLMVSRSSHYLCGARELQHSTNASSVLPLAAGAAFRNAGSAPLHEDLAHAFAGGAFD